MRFRRRNPAQATVREAIEYLASACDGAVRRDGHGFNKEHVAIGHDLAGKRRWSTRDRRSANRVVAFYRTQLELAGLVSHQRRTQSQPVWAADPTGVHRLRFWSGTRWTAATVD